MQKAEKKGGWNKNKSWSKKRRAKETTERRSRETGTYEKTVYTLESKAFDLYYKKQLGLSDEEFSQFTETLKLKLPTTFRVNPLNANFQALTSLFLNPEFISDWRKSHTIESQ